MSWYAILSDEKLGAKLRAIDREDKRKKEVFENGRNV